MTDLAIHDVVPLDATVRLAASGDAAAFERLVNEHHPSMARVAFVVCGDPEMARDAVQSAWAIAWRRLGSLRQPEQVRSWLIAVAANEARQAARRRRSLPIVDVSTMWTESGSGDPAESIAIVDLQRVLRGLRPEDRTLLALRYVAGLDSTEIAAHLGGSPSGIRSRLARLLDRLRMDLDDMGGTDR
jgi:RNA polymerase sigma-70 factor (ECF subfamily)